MKQTNFSELSTVLKSLEDAQGADTDQREAARDAKLFIYKRDGQWEQRAWDIMDGRFRGTFDMCGPIVDNIAGEIEQSDFTLRVSPSGGDASEDTAELFDGIIRNIRNISNAEEAFNQAGRGVVISGFDCLEVVQDWVDADAFEQDLFIRRIPDAINSVWFEAGSTRQDRSDAKWACVLTAISVPEYKERFPKGSKQSVSTDEKTSEYWHKAEKVLIGRIVYKKPKTVELVRMTDGSVYEVDEKFESIVDELAQSGITEEKRRVRKTHKVYSRLFDNGGWLTDEQETVFTDLPIVPVYGNFEIIENKVVYSGKIEKLYDQQRSLNYAMSRDIEDGALSPSPTVWMTEAMSEGHDYSRMNIDRHGVRHFNVDDDNINLTPQYTGGPQSSPGLQTTIANMQQMIGSTANMFNAQQGNANPTQSGVAGAQQIEQGNIGSIKWFKSLEIAICQIGKVLINAIPKVYDSTRQVRLLNEDGTGKMITLNTMVFDSQSQKMVEINDLSKGQYDVVCDVGPAFNNQQKEMAAAFLEMSSIVPGLADIGSDIWVKNQQTPGMDQIAERLRKIQLQNGNIPESQWTDEERQEIAEQQAAAAQQPPQEDPMMVAARAEEAKAMADQMEAQNKQMQVQGDFQLKQQDQLIRMEEIKLKQQEFERAGQAKFNTDLINADQNQQKIDLQARSQEFNNMMAMQKQIVDTLSAQATTLKTLREAMGVDAVVGPTNTEAYKNQAEEVIIAQGSNGARVDDASFDDDAIIEDLTGIKR